MTASTSSGYLGFCLTHAQTGSTKQNASPFAILGGILCNAVGRVPASIPDRVPPSRILLITEHDDMTGYDAQSLAHFFLNLVDTTLINGNGRKAIFPRYIAAVPTEVVSAGVNCDVLECHMSYSRARNQPTPAHRGNRFVVRYTKDEPQVTISDGLKSLGPTEMFDNKSPRRADLRVIFKWLSTIEVRIHIWKKVTYSFGTEIIQIVKTCHMVIWR